MSESTSFGKYRLIAELGHGGMADVFLAVQAGPLGSGFSKLTVIKRLRPNLADEPEFVAMLVDEARIAARLNHPNVVQTNEVGEFDRQYFIAMEYLDGQPFHRIQHRVAQRAKDGATPLLTKEQQYVVVMDALAGLHHAHELADYDGTPLNVVHRDITPHNIFVTYEGQVKVVDFGIAKAVGRASETRQGVVKGKVRYMAPEQAIGHDVDRRADVFAAGVMLWEIAAGRRMWKDMDDLRIVQALISNEVPASPKEVEPSVPAEVDAICRRALAIKPEDRYATAEEFRADLEKYLADAGHLVDARRKLPAAVSELFKDKRAEIRSVIERQIAMAVAKPSGEFMAVKVPTEMPSSSTPIAVSVREPAREDAGTSVTEQQTAVYQPKKSPRRAIVVAALAAALCAVPVFAWRRGIFAHASASQPGAAADDIALHLTGNPANATVRIDDGPGQTLPLDLKVHRDALKHVLRFEANGFIARTEPVEFTRDLALTVDLAAAPAPADAKDKDRDKEKKSQPSVATWTPPTPARGAPTSAKTSTTPAQPVVAAQPEPTAAPMATVAPPAPDRSAGKSGAQRLGLDKTDPWAQPR